MRASVRQLGRKGFALFRARVDGADHLFGRKRSEGNGRAGHKRFVQQSVDQGGRRTDHRPRDERVVAIPVEQAELGPTDLQGVQIALKTGLSLARRSRYQTQHVGGGGLLLQRFREVAGALAQFVKQPRVFDRAVKGQTVRLISTFTPIGISSRKRGTASTVR